MFYLVMVAYENILVSHLKFKNKTFNVSGKKNFQSFHVYSTADFS